MPIAYGSSQSCENTASRSGVVRAAAPQSALSRAASSTIESKRSVAEEVSDRLHRRVDVVVGVSERDEHRLELRRRDVDPAREQMAEERGVSIGVARASVVVVAHGTVEEREHRADTLHDPERREPGFEPRRRRLETL